MILQRLKQFIDSKNISTAAFEKSIGMSNASFGRSLKNNGAIGTDKLENILLIYPEINPNWLLTGNGPMIIEENNNYPLNNNRLKIKDETTTYNKIEKEENIESEKIYLDLIKSQEDKIQNLNRIIGRLEYEIEILKQNQIEEPVVRDVGCAAAG